MWGMGNDQTIPKRGDATYKHSLIKEAVCGNSPVDNKNLSEGFASETITYCSFIYVQSHVSLLIYIQCTYMFNLKAVILLDTLHFESDTLLPLVEIEHRSDLWQWLLRVQHRVVHV